MRRGQSVMAMNRAISCMLLVLAPAWLAADASAQSRNQPAVLGGQGRYVFGQINEFNADQYMLDTQTGRLWRLVDTADGNASVLEPVPYTLSGGGLQAFPPDAQDVQAPLPAPKAEDLLPLRPRDSD